MLHFVTAQENAHCFHGNNLYQEEVMFPSTSAKPHQKVERTSLTHDTHTHAQDLVNAVKIRCSVHTINCVLQVNIFILVGHVSGTIILYSSSNNVNCYRMWSLWVLFSSDSWVAAGKCCYVHSNVLPWTKGLGVGNFTSSDLNKRLLSFTTIKPLPNGTPNHDKCT